MASLLDLLITTLFYGNILLLFTILPFANSNYFKISSFGSNTNSISYRGSALASSGSVQFVNPDYTCLVAQAISTEKVPVRDSKSEKMADFVTRFSFTVDTLNLPSSSYGDGLVVFFLAPLDFQIPPNSAGSYFNISNYRESNQNQIIVIEFDSFVDSWDRPNQHVRINKNSLTSSNYTDWNAADHTANAAKVIDSYNRMMPVASLAYDDYPTFLENSSISYQVNLKEVIPKWAVIDFSAAMGKKTENNLLHSWEFNSRLDSKWEGTPYMGPVKHNDLWKDLMIGMGAFMTGVVIAASAAIIIYIIRHTKKGGIVLKTRVNHSYSEKEIVTNSRSKHTHRKEFCQRITFKLYYE